MKVRLPQKLQEKMLRKISLTIASNLLSIKTMFFLKEIKHKMNYFHEQSFHKILSNRKTQTSFYPKKVNFFKLKWLDIHTVIVSDIRKYNNLIMVITTVLLFAKIKWYSNAILSAVYHLKNDAIKNLETLKIIPVFKIFKKNLI